MKCDLVLTGGRVIDPETGTDDILNVGIRDGAIAAVTAEYLEGRDTYDVGGLVVSPGFIDLHSHGQGIPELRLRAMDGVTTALDLEAGAAPIGRAYEIAAEDGRPVNYGFSASWALARMSVLAGVRPDGTLQRFLSNISCIEWQRAAGPREVSRILAELESEVAAGGLGVGILVGYSPGTTPEEYLAVSRLAARLGRPTFTHARPLLEQDPAVAIDGATEIVRAAVDTGAHMHYCHVSATSTRNVDRVLELLHDARAAGARVTTEAYPYGYGMTGIGAAFLNPEDLHRLDLTPQSIRYEPTGEWVADARRLLELREEDPGGLALVKLLDDADPTDFAFIERAMHFEDAAVASDAMPFNWTGDEPDRHLWPLSERLTTHPRSAGTFARTLRVLVRERALLTLPEALGRCTITPAKIVESTSSQMRRKGRVQTEADADLVIFDADTITDRATYESSTQASAGVRHVLVNGTFVVRDGELVASAMPGRPIRGSQ